MFQNAVEIRLLPGVIPALLELKRAGFNVGGVTTPASETPISWRKSSMAGSMAR